MAKECKWIPKEPADPAKVGRLATELGIDSVLAELLVKRGVETFDEARRFFDGCGDDLLRRRFKIMAYPLEFELDRQRGIHAGTVKEPERRLRFIAGDE